MKMRKQLVALVALLSVQLASAQTQMVCGVLADSITQEGEPFATVRVFRQGQSEKPVAMSVTDIDGKFCQEVKGRGDFVLQLASVGKQTVSRNLTLSGNDTLQLDTLWTRDDALVLQGVEITAHKPLVKMETDKMTYSVENDVDSKSSTLLDMLRKVPMVTVDGQDNITVNGSGSFKVYVDGKPNAMMSQNPSQVFKAIPASAVKSVEVVTNPGAKYDAEGTGGVLNIVMDKSAGGTAASLDGYNANINLQGGTRSLGLGAYVSGQQGRFSFSANSFTNYGFTNGTDVTSVQTQQTGDAPFTTTAHSKTSTRIPFEMGSLTLSYDIDSMSSVSANAGVTHFAMRNKGNVATSMDFQGQAEPFDYASRLKMANKRTTWNAGADYQRFLNASRTSQITLSYLFNYTPNTSETTNRFDVEGHSQTPIDLTDRRSENHENTSEHTFQADFTAPTFEHQTLNTGVKLMLRNAHAEADYFLGQQNGDLTLSPSLGMDYEHKNRIAAAYAEYEWKKNAFGAKAGLRYEHTWQEVEYKNGAGADFRKNYGSLVPTASVSYALAPTRNLGINYNMRISRPGLSYLNPYVDNSTPTVLSYGNTDLDVEKTHTVGLVYNLFSSGFMMNLTLNHNFCQNGIEQYSFSQDGLLNTTYGNIVHRRQTGLNTFINWSLTKNTRVFTNAGVSYNHIGSHQLGQSNHGWQANAMLGAQQKLPWNLDFSFWMVSNSRTYTLQGWSSGFNMMGARLAKSFLNDKLSIGVSGMTGLNNGGRLRFETFSQGNGFSNHMKIMVPVSNVQVQLTWNLGNQKVQQKQRGSKIQNDYMEKSSDGEQINSTGMPGMM